MRQLNKNFMCGVRKGLRINKKHLAWKVRADEIARAFSLQFGKHCY
jgi:hypothetical protein